MPEISSKGKRGAVLRTMERTPTTTARHKGFLSENYRNILISVLSSYSTPFQIPPPPITARGVTNDDREFERVGSVKSPSCRKRPSQPYRDSLSVESQLLVLRQRTSGQISTSRDFNGATFAFGLPAGGDECKGVSC
jgi:hypothetical protein